MFFFRFFFLIRCFCARRAVQNFGVRVSLSLATFVNAKINRMLHILVFVLFWKPRLVGTDGARAANVSLSINTRPRGIYRRAELRVYSGLRRDVLELFGSLFAFSPGVARRVI